MSKIITIILQFLTEDDYINNIRFDVEGIIIKMFVILSICIIVVKVVKEQIVYERVIREVVPKLRP